MAESKLDHWSAAAQRYDRLVELALGGNIRAQIDEKLQQEGHLGEVVEFGCGTGYYTKMLAAQADYVVATDFSDEMLRIAQARTTGADNVEFKNENWQHTSFVNESFDTIFAGLVMPFVEDKTAVLKESYRILKPEGRMILADPNPMLLKGYRRIQCLCRIRVAWRGKPPRGNFESISELVQETGLAMASRDIIKDVYHPSSLPVEYLRLFKS